MRCFYNKDGRNCTGLRGHSGPCMWETDDDLRAEVIAAVQALPDERVERFERDRDELEVEGTYLTIYASDGRPGVSINLSPGQAVMLGIALIQAAKETK